ncbi:hypothetical protein EV198_3329 [Roseivirga ehrenbergii]|uniref:Uncharacterized protein n=1 Tax=Roseivirga ehrenbergii (strain DSM 102268 / JCM 13514 / KCTC 12282 / NCIMB 14502 / KMM 6017) TaxID=279360 RepID=A0A150WY92_ROSEK|nr:hypothetical protein [Roseivirga ehrenbergii]KYG71447.1 hypothetical protein MB14_11785 [Roseivirga ehrenbergii]TCK99501.1 hypothetical protein EV198_3329 [Roseivirga ehrenbergii]
MKKVLTIGFLIGLFGHSIYGQGYEVLNDDPSKLIKGHVALEYLTVDSGMDNVSGSYVWALGVNIFYPLLPSLGLEGSLRTPLLKIDSSGDLAIAAEAGVSKNLFSKTKLKQDLKVLMSFSQSSSFRTTTTRTSTLTMPGHVRTEYFVRGGGYFRNSSYESTEAGLTSGLSTITHSGGYAGIGISRGTFFQFKSEETQESFALGSIFKFYADVLILPTSIKNPAYDDSDFIGWRLGVKWYNSPYSSENNFGRKKGFFGNMFAIGELGTRPYEGAVITASVGYIIKKF